jgi:hypothetical protein
MFSIPCTLLMFTVRGYQRFISPFIPARCRFYPSCSQYMLESLKLHGAIIGTALGVWRILRCNPFSRGGVDLVPTKKIRTGEPN